MRWPKNHTHLYTIVPVTRAVWNIRGQSGWVRVPILINCIQLCSMRRVYSACCTGSFCMYTSFFLTLSLSHFCSECVSVYIMANYCRWACAPHTTSDQPESVLCFFVVLLSGGWEAETLLALCAKYVCVCVCGWFMLLQGCIGLCVSHSLTLSLCIDWGLAGMFVRLSREAHHTYDVKWY